MNQDDVEAWTELSDIYLSKQNFTKALFCYEEIIANMPKNYLINLRYAETLYSAFKSSQDFDELVLARKYFSHAAILKEGTCIRALFGLVQCCTKIAAMLNENKKLQDSRNVEILATARKQLK